MPITARQRFDAACAALLERISSAPVLYAKKYGRGELDVIFAFSPSIKSKLPGALKQEIYAAARRWRVHQIYKPAGTRKFLPPPEPLTPSLNKEGAGQA